MVAFRAEVEAKMTVMVTRILPKEGMSLETASPKPFPP